MNLGGAIEYVTENTKKKSHSFCDVWGQHT